MRPLSPGLIEHDCELTLHEMLKKKLSKEEREAIEYSIHLILSAKAAMLMVEDKKDGKPIDLVPVRRSLIAGLTGDEVQDFTHFFD